MRIFGSDRLDTMLTRLGLKEGEAIIHPWINKALEKAQQKVEARNFDIRKNLLKFDNVQNDQRKVIFDQRVDLMKDESVAETVADMRRAFVEDVVTKHVPEHAYAEQWDVAGLKEELKRVLDVDLPVDAMGQGRGHRRRGTAVAHRATRRRAHGGQGGAMGPRRDALRREDHPAADAGSSLARASDHARSSAPGDRPARLRPARSAAGIQVGSVQPVRGDDRAPARGGNGAIDARRNRAAGRAGSRNCRRWRRTSSIRTPARTSWRSPAPRWCPRPPPIAIPKNPASWGKVGRNEDCPCGSGKKYKHCHGKYA